jgi:hypothetical protein
MALLALLLGACQLTAQVGVRSWGAGTLNQAGDPHAILVTDRSGKVLDVTFEPEDADLTDAVTAPAGRSNTLDVTWTGGTCDASTTVDIAARGAGLAITVAITSSGEACDAMGVPVTIRLSLSQPIPPAAVTVAQ